MPQKCSICTSPKRGHINRALLSGKRSLRHIAAQYGYSTSTLQRHKLHVLEAVQLARKSEEIQVGKSAYEQWHMMYKEAERKYRSSPKRYQVFWFKEWRGMF